jgi:hypothetical protein
MIPPREQCITVSLPIIKYVQVLTSYRTANYAEASLEIYVRLPFVATVCPILEAFS